MIFLTLFVLWIIFNGKITVEICIFGVVLSAALTYFSKKHLQYGLEEGASGGFSVKRLPYLVE